MLKIMEYDCEIYSPFCYRTVLIHHHLLHKGAHGTALIESDLGSKTLIKNSSTLVLIYWYPKKGTYVYVN